jgi:hypothetical protein
MANAGSTWGCVQKKANNIEVTGKNRRTQVQTPPRATPFGSGDDPKPSLLPNSMNDVSRIREIAQHADVNCVAGVSWKNGPSQCPLTDGVSVAKSTRLDAQITNTRGRTKCCRFAMCGGLFGVRCRTTLLVQKDAKRRTPHQVFPRLR